MQAAKIVCEHYKALSVFFYQVELSRWHVRLNGTYHRSSGPMFEIVDSNSNWTHEFREFVATLRLGPAVMQGGSKPSGI
jgi:hypothetical protein